MGTKCVAASLLGVLYWATAAQQQPPPGGQIVGDYRGFDIAVAVPVAPALLSAVVHQMAESIGTPAGIELIAEAPLPPDVRRRYRPVDSVVMTGKPLSDALNRLVEIAPDYEWRRGYTGVLNILPRAPQQQTELLVRRVPSFVIERQDITSALEAVHRLFDVKYKLGGRISSNLTGMQPDSAARFARDNDRQRVFSVTVNNGTVRDILNAIVAAHGAATWEVRFRSSPADYDNVVITFRGFAGWVVSANPRPARSAH